jgi:hypothetical protein
LGMAGSSIQQFMADATMPRKPTVRGLKGSSCSRPAASAACKQSIVSSAWGRGEGGHHPMWTGHMTIDTLALCWATALPCARLPPRGACLEERVHEREDALVNGGLHLVHALLVGLVALALAPHLQPCSQGNSLGTHPLRQSPYRPLCGL